MNRFFDTLGFDDASGFVDSTLHPTSLTKTLCLSSVLAFTGSFLENYVGIAPATAIVIFILFCMELFTGIRASKKEGNKFESRKFQKGFVKMFLYIVMIGSAHTLSQSVEHKTLFGWSFNVYEWLHYFFLNFTILQLIVSNIENFNRLGWSDFVPALDHISKFLNIKKGKDELPVRD